MSFKSKLNYKHTIAACYSGYIAQAIIVNYAPLLYVTFQTEFAMSLPQLASITAVCFITQLITDLLSAKILDKVGYRRCAVAAHILCASGLLGLAFLPKLLPPMAGLIFAAILYAIGGGLIEVIVSPMVEACPTKRKASAMGLLHSFYCWGCVFVVLVSTLLFAAFGIENWAPIACLWALFPAFNAVAFCFVPLYSLPSAEGSEVSAEGSAEGFENQNEGGRVATNASLSPADLGAGGFKSLAKNAAFWLLMLLMLCAGATELSVSQWASAFAEKSLGISKTAGDLAGPMAFSVLMGTSRVFYAKMLNKLPLEKFILIGACGCAGAYLLVSLPPVPILNLIGCGLCGLFVGILWPGTFSVATKTLPYGGTTLFAMLAFAGDLGCTAGPSLVGFISGLFGDNLQTGLLCAVIFPALAIPGILLLMKRLKKRSAMFPLQKQ